MSYRYLHDTATASDQPFRDEDRWQHLGVHWASRQLRLPAVSTGWPTLDQLLPGGGYPLGAVTELLISGTGIGELSLLLNCLANRLEDRPGHQIAFVSPPCRLNAPALTQAGLDCTRIPLMHCRNDGERVWCVEQMARSRAFAAFVIWSNSVDTTALRRLQLAAERAHCPVFVYRELRCVAQRSPAALRLAITCDEGRQQLEVRKCRGPAGARISGLYTTRDKPWQLNPAVRPAALEPATACNDNTDENDNDGDMARPAFPPLGAR